MLQTDLDRKIFMAQSFLDSAIFHEKTLNYVPKDMAATPEEANEKLPDIRIKRKVVTHFLYAMVFELSIKIIWGIEQKMDAPYHHNIWSIYKQLSQGSQQKISDMYSKQVHNTKNLLISQCNGQIDTEGKIKILNLTFDLQSLEDALKVNEQVVKNFKYDVQFNGKSSALCSVMWGDREIWAMPKAVANAITFPKALLEYAISLKT